MIHPINYYLLLNERINASGPLIINSIMFINEQMQGAYTLIDLPYMPIWVRFYS